jgi:AhpD family alkylhydroperoxidase
MTTTIEQRMQSPVYVVPEAMEALYALSASARKAGIRRETALFVELRASQINGCSFCVDMHSRELKEMGVSDERIWSVGAWREAPYYTDAERAALALTEALTRIADNPDPVPDEIWDEAADHYNERQLAGLILEIAGINVWNRLNVAVRQVAGAVPVTAAG